MGVSIIKKKRGDTTVGGYILPQDSVILFPLDSTPGGVWSAYSNFDNVYVMSGSATSLNTEGYSTHTHTVGISGDTSTSGSHTHSPSGVIGDSGSQTYYYYAGAGNTVSAHTHTFVSTTTGASGDHKHNAVTSTTSGATNNLPPFVALRWLTNSAEAEIPSGGIMMWYGSDYTLPSGFYICNGQNGTPDMRDKFIRNGSGTGSSSHSHSMPSISASGAHTHFSSLNTSTKGAGNVCNISTGVGANSHSHSNINYTTNSAGDHTHTIPDTGSATPQLPELYLYFIQYIGD